MGKSKIAKKANSKAKKGLKKIKADLKENVQSVKFIVVQCKHVRTLMLLETPKKVEISDKSTQSQKSMESNLFHSQYIPSRCWNNYSRYDSMVST